jgi:plastocyanin
MKNSLCTYAVAISTLLGFIALAKTPGTLAATPESSPSGIEVKIDNFSYSPAAVTVKAGTQVTWTNHDDIPHTVVSSDNVFKSKTLDTDEKFSFIPTKPGTYSYFCSIHPKMTAQIVVQ